MLPDSARKQVFFDVGAGAGSLLTRASAAALDVCDNEISEPAIQLCYERRGIRLSNQRLDVQPGRDRFDAITMWCVLAHVRDPRAELEAVLRLLKPGVLYFDTPRWCLIDVLGLALARLSPGRLSQILHRRITAAHMRLYGATNLGQLVVSVRLEVIDMRPKAAYSLHTQSYLASMHFPGILQRPVARGLDRFMDRDLFARNVLDVYLRKARDRTEL